MPPVVAAPLGGLLRAPFLTYARRTTGDVLDELGMSRELEAVLTAQWGDYGLPPGQSSFGMHEIVAAHYFDGGAHPIGGASAIVRGLVPTIERAGGAVVVAADVARILVNGGQAVGVRMADGREFRASNVISDAGARTTFGGLLPEPSAAGERLRQDIRAIGPSTAHLCLHVGLAAGRLTAPLPVSNLWIHPGADFDRNWRRLPAMQTRRFRCSSSRFRPRRTRRSSSVTPVIRRSRSSCPLRTTCSRGGEARRGSGEASRTKY